eukprot:351397-Chlamydomonas_euryale.AAC.6
MTFKRRPSGQCAAPSPPSKRVPSQLPSLPPSPHLSLPEADDFQAAAKGAPLGFGKLGQTSSWVGALAEDEDDGGGGRRVLVDVCRGGRRGQAPGLGSGVSVNR